MSVMVNDTSFRQFLDKRYKGKVYKIDRQFDPSTFNDMRVIVEFRIPIEEADELEMFRRITKVIDVIAEGDDG
jgi:hypothetical protein